MLGVALSTKFPAIGAISSWAHAGVGAIATQARTNPLLAIEGLDLLEEGLGAGDALRKLLARDNEPERRQLAIVDARGETAAHTGGATDTWCGHRTGENYAVAGNLLIGEETVTAMAETFEASSGQDFAERLLMALEAGQGAGGDRRGRQSAALYVVHTERYPYLDLRVDEHPDPVAELRRVYEVAREEMLPLLEALPTRSRPKVDLGEEIRGTLIPED
jgi:uncharacterized Ntn-hydrolase superfamily protein